MHPPLVCIFLIHPVHASVIIYLKGGKYNKHNIRMCVTDTIAVLLQCGRIGKRKSSSPLWIIAYYLFLSLPWNLFILTSSSWTTSYRLRVTRLDLETLASSRHIRFPATLAFGIRLLVSYRVTLLYRWTTLPVTRLGSFLSSVGTCLHSTFG